MARGMHISDFACLFILSRIGSAELARFCLRIGAISCLHMPVRRFLLAHTATQCWYLFSSSRTELVLRRAISCSRIEGAGFIWPFPMLGILDLAFWFKPCFIVLSGNVAFCSSCCDCRVSLVCLARIPNMELLVVLCSLIHYAKQSILVLIL